jgi:hypothetical protein
MCQRPTLSGWMRLSYFWSPDDESCTVQPAIAFRSPASRLLIMICLLVQQFNVFPNGNLAFTKKACSTVLVLNLLFCRWALQQRVGICTA